MKPITVKQLCDILGVPITRGSGDVLISGGISTDTRKLAKDSVFFALRGENFNGDHFALNALDGGAAVVVVQDWVGELPPNTALVVVPDVPPRLELITVCTTAPKGMLYAGSRLLA